MFLSDVVLGWSFNYIGYWKELFTQTNYLQTIISLRLKVANIVKRYLEKIFCFQPIGNQL